MRRGRSWVVAAVFLAAAGPVSAATTDERVAELENTVVVLQAQITSLEARVVALTTIAFGYDRQMRVMTEQANTDRAAAAAVAARVDRVEVTVAGVSRVVDVLGRVSSRHSREIGRLMSWWRAVAS